MERLHAQRNDSAFRIQNILILIMILFFGFTSLRFGMFGIGELILLYFCGVQLIGQQPIVVSMKNHIFSLFWMVYLGIITFGYAVNTFLFISPQSVTFDYRAYLVILFLCFTFETFFKNNSYLMLYRLLRFIYFWGLFVVGVFYILYLQGTRILFGYYITYAGSDIFSPFANDYHQFAYFVAPLPFIGLYIVSQEKTIRYKVLAAAGIILSIKMGLSTTSSTLLSAWIGSLIVLCTLKGRDIVIKHKKSASLTIFIIALTIIAFIFSYKGMEALVDAFFHGDSNGANRITIWTNAIGAWKHSPIFGLGPGSYSGERVFGGYEAHNTFLQILTQGGIIGGCAYILLVFTITKNTYFNTFILCAVISLLMYGLGINDLRRTVLWFYYILFYFLCLKSKGENH